jgi:hypothetical protein
MFSNKKEHRNEKFVNNLCKNFFEIKLQKTSLSNKNLSLSLCVICLRRNKKELNG